MIYAKKINDFYSICANRNIKKNEIILKLDGIIIDNPNKYTIQIGANQHVIFPPSCGKNDYLWRFLNHSCSQNAYFNIEEKTLIALENIEKDEEITFNYNTTEYEISEPFLCNCKSDNCIKYVEGYKFLSSEQRAEIQSLVTNHIFEIDKSFN